MHEARAWPSNAARSVFFSRALRAGSSRLLTSTDYTLPPETPAVACRAIKATKTTKTHEKQNGKPGALGDSSTPAMVDLIFLGVSS